MLERNCDKYARFTQNIGQLWLIFNKLCSLMVTFKQLTSEMLYSGQIYNIQRLNLRHCTQCPKVWFTVQNIYREESWRGGKLLLWASYPTRSNKITANVSIWMEYIQSWPVSLPGLIWASQRFVAVSCKKLRKEPILHRVTLKSHFKSVLYAGVEE